MTDIVERLHKRADALGEVWMHEAAAEIERLRKIEVAYNNLVQADNDLLRAKRFVES